MRVISETSQHIFFINAYVPPHSHPLERRKAISDVNEALSLLKTRYDQFSCFIYMDANEDIRKMNYDNSDIIRFQKDHHL